MNDLKHLKKLSSIKSNAGVKFLTPAAFPGNHCPMHTALALSGKIKGLSTLIIGTPECTTYSRMIIPKTDGENGELHWMYVLDSHEVVFGCRDGIVDALKKMDMAGAKAVLIIVTCVPEIIGEDIEGIIFEIQPEIKASLTFVLMGHFKCNSYPSGSWKTLLSIGNLMRKRETSLNTINVLGRSPEEDHVHMPAVLSLLEKKGFSLRFLAMDSSLEDFINAADAALNIVISPFTQPLAVMMEQEFDIPYISLHNTYDVFEIDKAYAEIEENLRIEWGNEFEEERRHALFLQEEAKKILAGLKFVSAFIGPSMVVPFASYLAGLGMEPLLLHMEEVYPEDKIYIKELTAKGYNPPVCHMVNNNSDIHVIERLSPDIYFGYLAGEKLNFTHVHDIYDLYGQVGYERTSYLLGGLLQTFDNRKQSRKEILENGTA
ncbi:nitrogenase component 1 [Sedimentibacter sp.]|uniref:nitrogenase component 1 n=1 Tax=Sedimentibacter sp. TaxID=1960295 RepID=UPI0028AB645A|nr:nitrogenase component 1 [Sedimentibacter sp.]